MAIFVWLVFHILFVVNAFPNFIIVLTDDQDLILGGLVSKLCRFVRMFKYSLIYIDSHGENLETSC